MPPSSRSQSAATTALTAGIGELFRVKRLREIPHWWILGRCAPPTHNSHLTSLAPSTHRVSEKWNPKICPFETTG